MGLRLDFEAFDLVAKDEVEQMSIVQEIMLKSTDYLRRIIAPVGGQGGVTMSYLCPNCNSFPWKTTFGGSLLERSTPAGGVRFVEKKYDWKQPNRLLVVQTGDRIEQVKVFKAHAIPQGLCENLINALKLLANQQEDCDKPRQRKQERSHGRPAGLQQGGQSSRLGCWRATPRHGNFHSPEAKSSGRRVGCYTLRAEEVNTSMAFIDVNHIKPERWCPPLVDADLQGDELSFGCQKTAGGSEGKSPVGYESSQGQKGRVL